MASTVTDTLRNASEAFRQSTLALPTGPENTPGADAMWSDSIINRVLAIAFIVLAMLYLTRILKLLPYLVGGMTRWRAAASIEESVSLTRDRNEAGMVSLLGMVLLLSRFEAWAPSLGKGSFQGEATLVTLAIAMAYLFLRHVLFAMTPSSERHGRNDFLGMGHRAFYNWTTLGAIMLGVTAGAFSLAGVDGAVVKTAFFIELVALWIDYLLVEVQFFANGRGLFKAFLYLCELEILPMAALLATELVNI